jgi:hypothetical protein
MHQHSTKCALIRCNWPSCTKIQIEIGKTTFEHVNSLYTKLYTFLFGNSRVTPFAISTFSQVFKFQIIFFLFLIIKFGIYRKKNFPIANKSNFFEGQHWKRVSPSSAPDQRALAYKPRHAASDGLRSAQQFNLKLRFID